jgi:polyhydroxybutyrate depolymerase
MRRSRNTLATAVLAAGLAACASPGSAADRGAPVALQAGRLEHGGRQRTYALYVPPGAGPFPLVVALHGRLGDGEGQDRLSGLAALAARERFIAVFPDGYRRSWNDARHVGPAAAAGIDDAGFLSALVDELVAHRGADPARVYAVGMSNGAMMALTLACGGSAKLAGVVAVAGLWPAGVPCAPAHPVSVAVVAGDADPLVPYRGGAVARGQGTVLSAAETLEALRRAEGCRTPEPARALPDADPGDGTTTAVAGWTGCAGGAEVRLYTVHGGGHAWPGGLAYLGERWIGRTARDFSASEEAWRFLSPRRLPAVAVAP